MVVLSSLMDKKTPVKNTILIILLLLLGLLMARAFYDRASHSKPSQTVAVMAVYRSEMLLRLADAVNLLQKRFSTHRSQSVNQEAHLSISQESNRLVDEAQASLRKAVQEEPNDITLSLRQMILETEVGVNNQSTESKKTIGFAQLKNVPDKEADLVKLVKLIYQPNLDSNKVSTDLKDMQAEQILTKSLGNGWFKEHALSRFYELTNHHEKYEALAVETEGKTWQYVMKLILLGIAVTFSVFIGLIIIAWQLFSHTQPITHSVSAPHYSWQLVSFVFLLWFFTQILISICSGWLKKSGLNLTLANVDPLTSAISIAIIYLLSNGTVLLYIYFFAIRPNSDKFFDALKIKVRAANYNAGKIITIGILAWFAALPVVMLAYLVSSKIFGANGSNNPIIAVVMETAHTDSFVAIILFYLTLGVLAPLCEESLFRGFFYRYLRARHSPLLSNFISAGLFSVAHLDPGAVLPLFCLGSIFAYLFEITDSIVPSMIAHGLWNSGTFTLVLLLFGS